MKIHIFWPDNWYIDGTHFKIKSYILKRNHVRFGPWKQHEVKADVHTVRLWGRGARGQSPSHMDRDWHWDHQRDHGTLSQALGSPDFGVQCSFPYTMLKGEHKNNQFCNLYNHSENARVVTFSFPVQGSICGSRTPSSVFLPVQSMGHLKFRGTSNTGPSANALCLAWVTSLEELLSKLYLGHWVRRWKLI